VDGRDGVDGLKGERGEPGFAGMPGKHLKFWKNKKERAACCFLFIYSFTELAPK